MTDSPLGTVEKALARGFRVRDVRSDDQGIEVVLEREDEAQIVEFSRSDARRILAEDVVEDSVEASVRTR